MPSVAATASRLAPTSSSGATTERRKIISSTRLAMMTTAAIRPLSPFSRSTVSAASGVSPA